MQIDQGIWRVQDVMKIDGASANGRRWWGLFCICLLASAHESMWRVPARDP